MRYFLDLLAELEKEQVLPLYLFYGPEVYLQREAVRRFRLALVKENDTFNFENLDGEEISPRELVGIANTPPLFALRRLVVVKRAPYFSPGRGREDPSLVAYLKRPAGETCLIFCTAGPVDKRRETFKLVEEQGRAIEFTHLAPEDLRRWMYKRARQAGKRFAPGAEDALLITGRDLTVLNNEIEKVFAYTGDNEVITAGDVAAVISPAAEEAVFAAMDAFGERRYIEAMAKLRVLLEREPPGAVLALLARQLRLILLTQDILASGKKGGVLSKELGVHPFVAKKVAVQAQRFPRAEVEALFWGLLELDAAVKTGKEEFLGGLEQRLLQLSLGRHKNF